MPNLPCTGTKVCTHCHQTKHVLAFPAQRRKKDGTNSWCRACLSEYNHKYRLRHGQGESLTLKAKLAAAQRQVRS